MQQHPSSSTDPADASNAAVQPRRRDSRGAASVLVIGGSAVAALALVGGGAFVASQLTGGGDQPADVLPADTLAYLRVDLDPSASQKVDLLRLLQRVPEFEETTGISSDKEDLRRTLAEAVLSEVDCDVDYDNDIRPWIGDRAAFAAIPGKDEPAAAALLQVTDASAAESALAAISDCFGGEDAGGAFAFIGDYVVIAETQAIADTVVSGGEDDPLSDQKAYADDMDRLGDQGVASFWVDVPAAVEAAREGEALGLGFSGADPLALGGATSTFGALRAGSDSIELAMLYSGEQFTSNAASPVAELPGTTLAAFSVSGLGERVPDLWDRVQEASGMDAAAFERGASEFERATGLRMPDDLATLLGENLTVAMDAEGVEALGQEGARSFPEVNAGVRFSGEEAAIVDVVKRLQAFLTRTGVGVELATEEVDGGVVVATNTDYATAMTDGGLSGSENFENAVGDVEDVAAVFYLDIDAAETIVRNVEPGGSDAADIADYLEPMEAIGVNATTSEEYSEASVRLTFDD